MILTVTLNPCIDKTIVLSQPLVPGSRNISRSSCSEVGGKGINVSTVLSHFQVNTVCTGFNFKENARILIQALEARCIPHHFITTDGALRTNIKIFDPSDHAMTELNERGAFIDAAACSAILDKLEELLPQATLLVLSGSLPPGVPTDIYKQMILLAHKYKVPCILDTCGEALLSGLEAKPFLIKPNLEEFKQSFQTELSTGNSVLSICRSLIREKVSLICLSLGHAGALMADSDNIYYARPLPIIPRGMTGAGDSMVAGICFALQQKNADTSCLLRCAMAAAAASVQLPGTSLATKADFESLLPLAEIIKLK